MRALGQPEVLKSAALAAAVTAAACYPRLAMGTSVTRPVWYLEAILLLGGTVLWGFVFAWHSRYSGRPVFNLKPEPNMLGLASLAAVALGAAWFCLLDPIVRGYAPEDFATTPGQWLARTLFNLAFVQLFLVFAPYAWLLRLCRKPQVAVVLTVLFGAVVLVVRHRSSPLPLPPMLVATLLFIRGIESYLCVHFFLRGGVLLVWWWGLLLQSRHLVRIWIE